MHFVYVVIVLVQMKQTHLPVEKRLRLNSGRLSAPLKPPELHPWHDFEHQCVLCEQGFKTAQALASHVQKSILHKRIAQRSAPEESRGGDGSRQLDMEAAMATGASSSGLVVTTEPQGETASAFHSRKRPMSKTAQGLAKNTTGEPKRRSYDHIADILPVLDALDEAVNGNAEKTMEAIVKVLPCCQSQISYLGPITVSHKLTKPSQVTSRTMDRFACSFNLN